MRGGREGGRERIELYVGRKVCRERGEGKREESEWGVREEGEGEGEV